MKTFPLNEIPPTPLYKRRAFRNTMPRTKKSSSPFVKGGSRGILLKASLIRHEGRVRLEVFKTIEPVHISLGACRDNV